MYFQVIQSQSNGTVSQFISPPICINFMLINLTVITKKHNAQG